MATHSSVFAWRIPGMGVPGGLLSMGSHRVGHDGSDLAAAVTFYTFSLTLINGKGEIILNTMYTLRVGVKIFLNIH